MAKYKMTIAYDGTRFAGWQVQKNATSIQTLIQKALVTVLREPVDVTGSGRTDAGVHALGQVAHFSTANTPNLLSLNALLPQEIRMLKIEEVDEDFHARYSATSKCYHYHLHLGRVRDPFTLRTAYHVPHPVCLERLKEGAAYFVGEHDFTSFTNQSEGKNSVRNLYRLDVIEEGSHVRLEFEGNGFLYKMVRNIVGTLLDISCGKIAVEELPGIFAAKDRRCAGRAAPAHGLFLMEVLYQAKNQSAERRVEVTLSHA